MNINSIYVAYSSISRSLYSRLTYIHAVSHLNPCPDVCDSPPSRWCLSSRSLELHLNSIHVQSQTHPDLKMCVSPTSRPCLIYIQVARFLYQLLQCTFSLSSRPRKCKSTKSRPISNSFWSQDVCFTSIHVLPHQQHPGLKSLVSSPSMYQLISIQVQRFLSHPGLEIRVSPQSRLQYSHAFSIQIVYHVNKCTYICISHESM